VPAPCTPGRHPTSLPRLLVEAFGTTLAVIAAFWLVWVAIGQIEQHWGTGATVQA
jgi:hypothetical protein